MSTGCPLLNIHLQSEILLPQECITLLHSSQYSSQITDMKNKTKLIEFKK